FNHRYWLDLRKNDREKYKTEKQRIAAALADMLEKRFGNVKEHLEVTDVSTPATVVRYTNNWKGSFEGWVMTPQMGFRQMKKQLPGLKNFYMAGQWVSPGGGLPSGLITGRGVAQILCKQHGKKFRTEGF
ncbi:MAG: FAD-dependent oxidoreductase, partial [Bacteroidales bacterium]